MSARKEPHKKRLNFSEALGYVDRVKAVFSEEPDVYDEFLHITKEYQRDHYDVKEVFARVELLFLGYREMMVMFLAFASAQSYDLDTIRNAICELRDNRGQNLSLDDLQELANALGLGKERRMNRLGSRIWSQAKDEGLWSELEAVVDRLLNNKERLGKPLNHRERDEVHRRPGHGNWAEDEASHLEQIAERWLEIEVKERKRAGRSDAPGLYVLRT